MDLPEHLGIELFGAPATSEELIKNEPVGVTNSGVLGVGAQIGDFRDCDHTQLSAVGHGQPLHVLRARRSHVTQQLSDVIEIGRALRQAATQAFHREEHSFGRDWFEHVVDRTLLEGGDGILVEGSDEGDVGTAVQPLRNGQPVESRHLDVEEYDIGTAALNGRQRLRTIAGFRHHRQFRPQLAQGIAQFAPNQGLVLGEDGSWHGHCWPSAAAKALAARCRSSVMSRSSSASALALPAA